MKIKTSNQFNKFDEVLGEIREASGWDIAFANVELEMDKENQVITFIGLNSEDFKKGRSK